MSLFNPSRDEVRSFFFEAWRKSNAKLALTDLERMAVQIIQLHPEYHAVLNHPELYMQQAYFPELGETNPFLHMSLHLSILEQISINQPIGITSIYQKLCTMYGDEHEAQHAILDCLGETIWHAQRHQTPLDNEYYLRLLHQKAGLQLST
jgi:hypothetical protein